MPRAERAGAPGGRLTGALVVVGLAGIATTLVVRQLRRPPWREPVLVAETAPTPTDLAPFAAPWVAVGPAAGFTAATLYEKIDGQADLYLQAGFSSLSCQRFVDPADPQASLEVRLFTMRSAAAARSVLARQSRLGWSPLGEGLQGGCADGACFLTLGNDYLEVLPAGTGEARAQGVALAFAAARTSASASVPDLFPAEGLVPGSVAERVPAAYGLATLDGVDTASYLGSHGPMLAWIARGTDGPTRRDAVRAELEHLGGAARTEGAFVVIQIHGSTCVLAAGPGGAAGVQEAADPAEALALAGRLAATLEGGAP